MAEVARAAYTITAYEQQAELQATLYSSSGDKQVTQLVTGSTQSHNETTTQETDYESSRTDIISIDANATEDQTEDISRPSTKTQTDRLLAVEIREISDHSQELTLPDLAETIYFEEITEPETTFGSADIYNELVESDEGVALPIDSTAIEIIQKLEETMELLEPTQAETARQMLDNAIETVRQFVESKSAAVPPEITEENIAKIFAELFDYLEIPLEQEEIAYFVRIMCAYELTKQTSAPEFTRMLAVLNTLGTHEYKFGRAHFLDNFAHHLPIHLSLGKYALARAA